jgi:hypothetical protein
MSDTLRNLADRMDEAHNQAKGPRA